MLITEFYANREIFITGGTGYLGKALIEKLLRDCPNVKTLYVLLRARKPLNAEQRLEELKRNKVFDRIRKECPQVLKKLHAIAGDSKELGLGIKAEDLELLKNVSIIFHMAANVKFDDPLRSSILLNTRGTYELVKIAETLKNLIVFLYCSTAYCNPFRDTVEEKVYKISSDWRKTIKVAENCDEYTIDALCKKYTGHYPNTYTFTKNLSEQIIQEYSTKLPMFIFRPSVVMGAIREPVAGWIDNMNGPVASMIGMSVGVIPMFQCKRDLIMDCIPIDIVTKLTIVAAYKRGIQKLKNQVPESGLEVVNCASGGIFNMTMEQALKFYHGAIAKNPMENCIWRFDLPLITPCYYHFLLYICLINVPVAIMVDSLLCLLGKEPLLLKITRRIIYTRDALQYFANKSFIMKNQNMINLEKSTPTSELETFGILKDSYEVDYFKYFDDAICGVKENLFNQPIEASDGAKLRYQILYILNKTIKLLLFVLIVRYLWLKVNY